MRMIIRTSSIPMSEESVELGMSMSESFSYESSSFLFSKPSFWSSQNDAMSTISSSWSWGCNWSENGN